MTSWTHRPLALAITWVAACHADEDDVVVRDGVDDPDTAVAIDSDPRDTDVPFDTDPAWVGCRPRELLWRAENAPRIGLWGTGGIAWHPTTGLRVWGGCELEGEENCNEGQFGPLHSPWNVRAERWRDVLNLLESVCMVRADGSFDCRDHVSWTAPSPVRAIGFGPGLLCAYGEDFSRWCAKANPAITPAPWPPDGTPPLSIHGGFGNPDPAPWLCELAEDGRMRCEGRPELDVFEADGSCWVEVVNTSTSICGIDQDGGVTCRHFGLRGDGATDLVGTDLSHLSMRGGDACAVDSEGRVHCAGEAGDPLMTAPAGTGFVDVALAERGVCALSQEGSIECWGAEDSSFVFARPDQILPR
jgi:hypothetical protein